MYTMGQTLQNWRILWAALLSAALVIGAYMLARSVESPSLAQASTESELLQAIAKKDSDGDGLSDWEEALYGTDSRATDSFNLGMTDGEAVAKGLIVPKAIANMPAGNSSAPSLDSDGLPPAPVEGTLTDAFTKNFLNRYMAARGANGDANLSQAQLDAIAAQSIADLGLLVTLAPDFKKEKDIAVHGSGEEALIVFAASVDDVSAHNRSPVSKSELLYLKDALAGDASALSNIRTISASYRNTAIGIAALPVPKEMASADLAFINALMKLSTITADISRLNEDPLTTILALEQYTGAMQGMLHALKSIHEVYQAQGVAIPKGTPGSVLLRVAELASRVDDLPSL